MISSGIPPSAPRDPLSKGAVRRAVSPGRYAMELLGWALGYLVLAALGHWVVGQDSSALPAWPAAGLAVALLTLRGKDCWPLVILCAFLSNYFLAGNPATIAAFIAIGSTLEALVGSALLHRLRANGEIAHLRDVMALGVTSLLAPIPSAFLGALVLTVFGNSILQRASHTGFVWWLSDLMGILTLTPVFLGWLGRRVEMRVQARHAEFALVIFGTIALVGLFYGYSGVFRELGVSFLPPTSFLLPTLIWAVLRLRPRESVSVLAVSSVLAVAYTMEFYGGHPLGALLWVEILLFSVVSGSLFLIGAMAERRQIQQELARKEARFRNVFDQAAAGMAMLDTHGRLIAANRKLCEIIGYTREELLGRMFSEISDPSCRDYEPELFTALVTERKTDYTVEKRYRRKDGTPVWVRITSSLLHDEGLAHCVSIVEDISMRQQAEAALLQSEERLRYVTDAADVGYWDWDIASDRLEWSDRCKVIFGIAHDEQLSYPRFIATIKPEDQSQVNAAVNAALEGRGDYELEFRVTWPCGAEHWIHTKGKVAFDEKGKPMRMAGVAIDVTVRKAMEDAVRRLSLHDPLTGLPNRALIYEYAGHLLSQAHRGGGRLAFVFVDLDNFKPINDNYGHDAGDWVLKEVARRLADCVRGEDFVGRLGGDEFLAVLSHIHGASNAARVASQALTRLNSPIRFGELSLQVSPSIGLAVWPEDGNTLDELIKNADMAMYHAKEMGRNNFQFFRPEMNERTEQARVMEHKLRRAVEQGEFQLHFQPVVQLADGLPRSAEALLRWPGAAEGPDRFIPSAESAGLMPALGIWVLREVCRQQRRWLDQGLPFLPVAVNISAHQLRDERLPEYIRGATLASGLSAEGVCVECPEQAVTCHNVVVDRVLADLRLMGVKVAVDNFGVGAFCLSELGHLPLNSFKLDRSFVGAIGRDPAAIPVIDTILALGRSLHLDVVAEGIESEEALAFLRERHCPLGQGYLFTPPLPADEFEHWYREALAA